MPPHLHPRSAATSTLFAGTLLASFVVVGIPHIFPCPRPRTRYADSAPQFDQDGRPIQRQRTRRKLVSSEETPADSSASTQADDSSRQIPRTQTSPSRAPVRLAQERDLEEEAALFRELQREAEALEHEARECPVPKPRGLLGRVLGFNENKTTSPPPPPSLSTIEGKS